MIMNIQELKKHKFIVFCRDHNNPLGLCRSIGESGIVPVVVVVGRKPNLINHSKYAKDLHYFEESDAGLKFIIANYSNEKDTPFLLTGQDDLTELVDQNFNILKDRFYFYNEGAQGLLTYNNQKDVQCESAKECGIRVPKGVVLKKGELPQDLRYPVLTKVTMATKGAWKKDVHICNCEQELVEAWKEIQADEMLVQEYIEKKNELCIDGFSVRGGEEVFLSYTSEYIRFTKKGFGNYMWMKQYNDEDVKNKIKKFIKKANYTGIFCLECIIDKNDELFFLECNFRYSGWGYAHTFGGVNLPLLWADSIIHEGIDTNIKLREKPFTAMDELADYADTVLSGKMNVLTWLIQVLRCDVLFNHNSKDWGVTRHFFTAKLKRLLHI